MEYMIIQYLASSGRIVSCRQRDIGGIEFIGEYATNEVVECIGYLVEGGWIRL